MRLYSHMMNTVIYTFTQLLQCSELPEKQPKIYRGIANILEEGFCSCKISGVNFIHLLEL
jgi:hypothetical protein